MRFAAGGRVKFERTLSGLRGHGNSAFSAFRAPSSRNPVSEGLSIAVSGDSSRKEMSRNGVKAAGPERQVIRRWGRAVRSVVSATNTVVTTHTSSSGDEKIGRRYPKRRRHGPVRHWFARARIAIASARSARRSFPYSPLRAEPPVPR